MAGFFGWTAKYNSVSANCDPGSGCFGAGGTCPMNWFCSTAGNPGDSCGCEQRGGGGGSNGSTYICSNPSISGNTISGTFSYTGTTGPCPIHVSVIDNATNQGYVVQDSGGAMSQITVPGALLSSQPHTLRVRVEAPPKGPDGNPGTYWFCPGAVECGALTVSYPPTATPVPPTATSVPPTETPAPPISTVAPQPSGTPSVPSPTGGTGICPLKNEGDANCDGVVDIKDFNIWQKQLDTVVPASPVNNNSNFACVEGNTTTYFSDLVDFEIWRRNTTSGLLDSVTGQHNR